MEPHFQHIVETVEPLEDKTYGNLYRCSLTLKDGTFLPCAMLQSDSKTVSQAMRRIKQEMNGEGMLRGPDSYRNIVSVFVTGKNWISDTDVSGAEPSKFAPPVNLLEQIDSETFMGWTGWVFEMSDGRLFPYGTRYTREFFQLPDGYSFDDVANVHNHSYLNGDDEIRQLRRGVLPPDDYDMDKVFRERIYLKCGIEEL